MDAAFITRALADISGETDPTVKAAKMASLCSALFLEHGIQLVVVGGSGIELLTDGLHFGRSRLVSHHTGSDSTAPVP